MSPPLLSDADVGIASTPDLSHMSDEDLEAIAAMPDFGQVKSAFSGNAQGPTPNFDTVRDAFSGDASRPRAPPMPNLSSMSDEDLEKIAAGGGDFLQQLKAAQAHDRLLSDAEVGLKTPAPQGPLSNAPNEGWVSGFENGLGTAGVRGLSAAAGAPTLLGSFIDEGLNRLTSLATGKPLDQVRAQAAANRAREPSLVTNTMPSDIEDRIAQYTGSYEPTSAPGRIGQAAATGVVAGALLGPLGGEAAPPAVVPNAVGAGTSQAATEMGFGPGISTAAGLIGGIGSDVAASSQLARTMTKADVKRSLGKSSSAPKATRRPLRLRLRRGRPRPISSSPDRRRRSSKQLAIRT